MNGEDGKLILGQSEAVNALEVLHNVAYLIRTDAGRRDETLEHVAVMERALAALVRDIQES